MEHLDNVASEYLPNAATAIENNLLLHYYPKRIINKCKHCEALLELGIGHGFTNPMFEKICDRHVIIEGSKVVIDLFHKNHPDFSSEIVLDYFETFESNERFDIIIMGFVLEHVDDPELIVSRYKKLLKPGGRVFIAVPNAKSLNRRLGLEMGIIDDIYSLNANDLALGHKRQFCRDTLKQLLVGNGYRIVSEEGIYLKPLPLSVLQTMPDFHASLQAMLKVGIDFPDLCVALLMEATPQ